MSKLGKTNSCEEFVRKRSGNQIETDRHEDLLDSSPQRSEEYLELEDLWEEIGQFSDNPEVLSLREEALQSYRAVESKSEPSTKNRRNWFTALFPLKYSLPGALAACLVLVVFTSGIWDSWLVPAQVFETRIAEQRQLILDDGTTVMLDSQSMLTARQTNSKREVFLERGQARFDVAKDVSRPFTVVAGNGEITALGTVFVVNRRNASDVVVTLIEGRILISQEESSALEGLVAGKVSNQDQGSSAYELQLEPGQQVQYSQTTLLEASEANIPQATAWQEGRLIFENDTLSDVLNDLNRYSEHKILFGDSSLKDLRITGVFKTGDHGKAVKALMAYFPVKVIEDSNGNLVLLKD